MVCTGAWTAQLLEKIGQKPDIRPVRGQMILFKTEPGGYYLIPTAEVPVTNLHADEILDNWSEEGGS